MRRTPARVLGLCVAALMAAQLGGCAQPLGDPGAREDESASSPLASSTQAPSARDDSPNASVLSDSGRALETLPWWGGPQAYRRFPQARKAGWTKDSFFPIAVFFGKPEHAPALARIGINVYMGAEHDGSPVSMITDTGISVIAQSEWTSAEVGDDPLVVGWHVSDECEMGYSDCTPDWDNDNGEQGRLQKQRQYVQRLRARGDGRFLQANFGNGVIGTFWAPTTMADHVALMDVTSVDKYAYTSPQVDALLESSPAWPYGMTARSARSYGWLQDRMESFASPVASKPNWVFVETAEPLLTEEAGRTITTAQIQGAVFNALIHGAAGIAYFQHNSNGRCNGMYSLVDCGEQLRDAVRKINARVTALAPVFNTPSYDWTFGGGLQTALKVVGGWVYVVAMSDGGTGARHFSLPSSLTGASSVQVVGESRTLRVVDGGFADSFAHESSVHVYRIKLP